MNSKLTKVRVFVSSPSDVATEREAVASTVRELNVSVAPSRGLIVELVAWETHCTPDMGRGQEIVNRQIGSYDIFVGIMAQRFGTPTGAAGSGTEEEFRLAYNEWGKTCSPRIMFYFRKHLSAPHTEEDMHQLTQVVAFRRELAEKGLVWEYTSSADFADVVRPHLVRALLDLSEDVAQSTGSSGVRGLPPSERSSALIVGVGESDPEVQFVDAVDELGFEIIRTVENNPALSLDDLYVERSKIAAVVVVGSFDGYMKRARGNLQQAMRLLFLWTGFALGIVGRRRTILLLQGGMYAPPNAEQVILIGYDRESMDLATAHLRRELRAVRLME